MSANLARGRWRLSAGLTGAALVWSVALVLGALLVPTAHGQSQSGVNGLTLMTVTAVQAHGAWILVPIALSAATSILVIAAISLRARGRPGPSALVAGGSVALLGVLALISIPTLGALLIPVVILLAVGLRLAPDAGSAT